MSSFLSCQHGMVLPGRRLMFALVSVGFSPSAWRAAYSSISFSDIRDLNRSGARFPHTECHTQTIGAGDAISHSTLAHILGVCRYFYVLLGGEILERLPIAFKPLLSFTDSSLQPKLIDDKISAFLCLAVMDDHTCKRFL